MVKKKPHFSGTCSCKCQIHPCSKVRGKSHQNICFLKSRKKCKSESLSNLVSTFFFFFVVSESHVSFYYSSHKITSQIPILYTSSNRVNISSLLSHMETSSFLVTGCNFMFTCFSGEIKKAFLTILVFLIYYLFFSFKVISFPSTKIQ